MGPYDGPNEQFSGEYPTSRYIVGRLAPIDQRVSDEEDDNLGAGEEEDEASETDDPLPLVLGFHTASIGLSFVLDHSCTHVDDVRAPPARMKRQTMGLKMRGRPARMWKKIARLPRNDNRGVLPGLDIRARLGFEA